jgi:hypothetical protein
MKDEALKLALEAWQTSVYGSESHHKAMLLAMTNMAQALAAQPPVQPVAWRWTNGKGWLTYGEMQHDRFESTPLYTTPPAPAVPDALNPKDENPAYAAGWNDCRQAMMEMMK